VILLAALGLSGPAHDQSPQPRSTMKCFSRKLWSADDRERPCVRIARVYEDGSFRASVGTATGRQLQSIALGNPRG
jgi:hypothetical protein